MLSFRRYLESLKAKGIQLYAAYGNTTTDIKAYEASGIPKASKLVDKLQSGSGRGYSAAPSSLLQGQQHASCPLATST